MKHRLRDSFIWLVSILGITSRYRSTLQRRGPLVRVLVFHDVEDGEWFEEVVTLIVSRYNPITPEQFHTKEFDGEKINILLTFDDGYQSWIDTVVPVLSEHTLRGLFFVCSGLLDIADDKEKADTFMREQLRISPKRPLTWDGARELIKGGHVIGGHTIHHMNLAALSSGQVAYEISEDKQTIESKLSITLADFAYPFGTQKHFNKNVEREVERQGYRFGYSAVSGFLKSDMKDRFAIPRTCIEKNQSIRSIAHWIEGGYDLFKSIM